MTSVYDWYQYFLRAADANVIRYLKVFSMKSLEEIAALEAEMKANPKTEKGEYCLILDFHDVVLPEEKAPAADVSLEARLVEQMLDGLDLRQAQSELVLQGEKKNAVKAAALRLKRLFQEEEE